jgi:hypothetical protein
MSVLTAGVDEPGRPGMIGIHGAALDRGGHLNSLSLATSDFISIGVSTVR